MSVNTTYLDPLLIPGTDADVIERMLTLSERAKDTRLGMLEEPVIILDTETTGLSSKRDELVQIAAVRMEGPEIVDRFSTFVDPGFSIPSEIVSLTGITDEDVAGMPSPDAAVEMLAAFAGGLTCVAHNAEFDKAFIMKHAAPGSFPPLWVDSLALAHIALPRLRAHRMDDLCAAFEIENTHAHRADADTEALARVWRILLTAVTDLPAGLCDTLAHLSPETQWPLRFIFQAAAGLQPSAHFSLRRCRSERIRNMSPNKPEATEFDVADDFPQDEELEEAFTRDGVAGAMYPDYEPREEQVAMAKAVAASLRDGSCCAVEAGTGVGKSMAYLLPSAIGAKRSHAPVGISTKTNALMDQLVYNELPRLANALDGLDYVALKGYEHYPCLRKIERFCEELDHSPEAVNMAATLLSWASVSSWGDLDSINLFWPKLPRYAIEASSNDCLKSRCPFHPNRCYLHGARRRSAQADIVVTNHALLFRDIQVDGGILPPLKHWVIDEAHAVESEARRQLSLRISARDLSNVCRRLTSSRNGTIATIRHRAAEIDGGDLLYGPTADIEGRISGIEPIATSFFSFIKDLGGQTHSGSGGYERATLWVSAHLRETAAWGIAANTGRSLSTRLAELIKVMKDLVSRLESFEGEMPMQQVDIAGATCQLEEMMSALDLVLDGSDTSYVYSVELSHREDDVCEALEAAKIDIGAELVEALYPDLSSVVYTSATIATGDSRAPFGHFMHSTGLDRLDETAEVETLQLDSSYNFDENMRILLPTCMPEPSDRDYHETLEDLLLRVHGAMGGSVLTLFTNRRDMEEMYNRLEIPLREMGIELLAQMRGTGTKRLRDAFMSGDHVCLFALKSFWEGFDAPGSTLRCVIIPKLPFGRPTDPLTQERGVRESNAWRRYCLPDAVLELKQAAGRLIRNSTDSGFLILADGRLQTKSYGKSFLRAMPTQNIAAMDIDSIVDEISSHSWD